MHLRPGHVPRLQARAQDGTGEHALEAVGMKVKREDKNFKCIRAAIGKWHVNFEIPGPCRKQGVIQGWRERVSETVPNIIRGRHVGIFYLYVQG